MHWERHNIALFYAVYFLQGLVFYSPIATLYRQAAGLDLLQIGGIESACLLTALALEVPWGVVWDTGGPSSYAPFCSRCLRPYSGARNPLEAFWRSGCCWRSACCGRRPRR